LETLGFFAATSVYIIYKEMGMAKKAKGIAFSLPVSDVAGLAPKAVPNPETEA
jgi:hypothetical protein